MSTLSHKRPRDSGAAHPVISRRREQREYPMSRAFVRELDSDAMEMLPDRPVSRHPNLVTEAGQTKIEARLRDLDAGRSEALAAEDIWAL